MKDQELLRQLGGQGIAVLARHRWRTLALNQATRYADELSLAELRRARPDWRAVSLAPVSIVDDPFVLNSVDDCSLDHVVAYHVFAHPDRIVAFFATAARLLRPGGSLLFSVPDGRYLEADDADAMTVMAGLSLLARRVRGGVSDEADGAPNENPWSIARLASLVGALASATAEGFDLEAIVRNGRDNVVTFRRQGARHATGKLLSHGPRIYVIDGVQLRHVLSPKTLDRINTASGAIDSIDDGEFAAMFVGAPLSEGEVAEFLARRDVPA